MDGATPRPAQVDSVASVPFAVAGVRVHEGLHPLAAGNCVQNKRPVRGVDAQRPPEWDNSARAGKDRRLAEPVRDVLERKPARRRCSHGLGRVPVNPEACDESCKGERPGLKPQIGHSIGFEASNQDPASLGTNQNIPHAVC